MQKIIEHCQELKYRLCQNIRWSYKKVIYEQAEWFIDAVLSGDPDAWQYAGNPDLVTALGLVTADRYLGLDLP